MKAKRTLLAAIAIAATLPTVAQTSLEQVQKRLELSFQRIANDPQCEVRHNIQVDRTPGAPAGKTSLCEINTFVIHKAKKRHKFAEKGENYVADIEAAIQAEANSTLCYRIASYHLGDGKPRQWRLLYGDAADQHILLGESRARNYTFICLLDPQRNGYRWCYALDWMQAGNEIYGRFIKLYAKMPEETSNQPGITAYKATMVPDEFAGTDTVMVEFPSDELRELAAGWKQRRTVSILQQFSLLRAQYIKDADAIQPVAIYTLCKEAAGQLNADEKGLLIEQLRGLIRYDTAHHRDTEGISFFRLAIKVLGGKP